MSFASAAVLIVIVVHAALLPALYFGLRYVVRSSHEGMFLDHTRTFARMIAEQMEATHLTTQQITDLLDLVNLNGQGAYAEYTDGHASIRSELNQPGLRMPGRQDFAFGDNADHTYFMILPIGTAGSAELRLGFDERPTEEGIQTALHRMLLILAFYWVLSLATGLLLSLALSRTVRRLQHVSRRIAQGDYAQRLHVESPISELLGLADDLDHMRQALVGANERLQTEMRRRENVEQHRQELEGHLRHRQRLETVGTLAGGIAHEFNNALLPIILFTQSVLQESSLAADIRADLERVLGSARRARQVVQKILVFGRKFDEVRLELLDLRSVIAEAIKLFEPLVPSDVSVYVQCDEPPFAVRADAAMLQQMLMNLCVNAYQALAGRPGRLIVGVQNVVARAGIDNDLPAERCVELFVQDTGHGMTAETMERIFEPFFTTREVGQGTGLGLSVVHGIADSFGARIQVDSRIGEGSTFRVFFPAVEDGALPDARPAPALGAV